MEKGPEPGNFLEEKYNDYEKTPVPAEARKTWLEQGMVWLGEGFGLSGLAVGHGACNNGTAGGTWLFFRFRGYGSGAYCVHCSSHVYLHCGPEFTVQK